MNNQHKQLACSVLIEALNDIANARKTRHGKLVGYGVATAMSFVFDNDQPMFEFWCDAAELEPWVIRRAARQRLLKKGYDVSMAMNALHGAQAN